MRIFHTEPGSKLHTLMIAPAAIDPSISKDEWFEGMGDDRHPRTLRVMFRNGAAEVDDALGRFLIHWKYARKTRPLLEAVFG